MNDELHDRGLAFDLTTLRDRRNVLKLLGGVVLVALVGCGKSNNAARLGALSPKAERPPNGRAHAIQTVGRAAPHRASPWLRASPP